MVKEIIKMLLRRFSLITALLLLSLTLPQITADSQAQTPYLKQANPSLAPKPLPSMGGEMLQELDLTETQRQQIATIQQKYATDLQLGHSQLQSAYNELRQMMIGTAPDADIRAKHQEIGIMRQDLADLRLESMLEVREVLTPDQRQEFANLMDERRQMWHDRHSARRSRMGHHQMFP
jgi:protein CpxP